MANNKSNNHKDQYLRDFVLKQQKLNDIEINLPEPDTVTDVKQFVLDNIQVAFARHLPQFRKAFAIGKDFAKKITNET
tara:strand:- start:843 stop:1076 length:234 start_codon:yes stop_codon:yes gene_type:complete